MRRTGIAFDRQEHEEGGCGVVAVLNCGVNDRFAVSIAVPTIRFERNLPALKATLQKCKAEIESQFWIL